MKQALSVALEVKSHDDATGEFSGYGSVFGNVDLGGDIVVRGAFARSLKDRSITGGKLPQMFWMHKSDELPPGVWTEMREDSRGLFVKGRLALDVQIGRELHSLLKMDAVRGLSIGYIPTDTDYDKDGNRLIKSADLLEVSIVSLAMNPLAQVAAVKSQLSHAGEYVPSARELEEKFRDMGCSRAVAKSLVAKLFDRLRDAGDDVDANLRDAGGADAMAGLAATAAKLLASMQMAALGR